MRLRCMILRPQRKALRQGMEQRHQLMALRQGTAQVYKQVRPAGNRGTRKVSPQADNQVITVPLPWETPPVVLRMVVMGNPPPGDL